MKNIPIGVLLVLFLLFISSEAQSQVIRSVDEAKGLEVGIKAPLFKAIDANRKEFSLENALKDGPVVIIFYRGVWCPVCNRHLSAIQEGLKLIEEKGARVIAISPQKPEYLEKMVKKTEAEFTVLYDEGYKIADAYDVTFTPTSNQIRQYNVGLRAKLKESQSDDSQRLPIPATYIINQKGEISWRQFDPNYKNRSTVEEILKALE